MLTQGMQKMKGKQEYLKCHNCQRPITGLGKQVGYGRRGKVLCRPCAIQLKVW